MAVLLLASGTVLSAPGSAEAQNADSSTVRLRVARLWRGEGRTLLEGVIGLPLAGAKRSVAVEVRDSTGKALYSERWEDSAHVPIPGIKAETTTPLQVLVLPGVYTIAVRSTEPGKVDSTVTDVRAFESARVLSDVVISPSMRVLAENGAPAAGEVQRGRYAIERSTRVTILPSGEARLWYYLELYRQGADSVAQLELRVVPAGKDSAMVRVTRNVAVSARGTVD